MPSYRGIPITDLRYASQVLATDVYAAVDVTDLYQSPAGSLKKYTIAELQTFLVTSFTGSNLETVYASATENLNAIYINGTAGVGATLTNNGTYTFLELDGISLSVGQRVLIQYQADETQNGIYTVTNVGDSGTPWVLTRATDFDGSDLGHIIQGDFVGVLFGMMNGLTFWFLTSQSMPVLGTDDIVFEQQTLETPWVNETFTNVSLEINTGYVCSAGASKITYTLPLTSPIGSYIEILGKDSGGWMIAQNSGQSIIYGDVTTTVGISGSLSSTLQTDVVYIVCLVANTTWTVTSSIGNLDVI